MHLRILFQSLNDYGIVINMVKYVFDMPEVLFLGHLVKAGRVRPEKVQTVRQKPPKSYVNVLAFSTSTGAVPLNGLLVGNTKG